MPLWEQRPQILCPAALDAALEPLSECMDHVPPGRPADKWVQMPRPREKHRLAVDALAQTANVLKGDEIKERKKKGMQGLPEPSRQGTGSIAHKAPR